MQRITIEHYIKDRLEDQENYYSQAATRSKKRFQKMKGVEIGLAAMVPFLSALINDGNAEWMKIIVGSIGVVITLLGGMLLLFKHQETWVTFRATAEALKSEKYLFLTRSGPYRGKGAQGLFIEKVEAILGDEHRRWQNFVIEQGDEEEESNEPAGNGNPADAPEVPADDQAAKPT
jgi:hypothetical protein